MKIRGVLVDKLKSLIRYGISEECHRQKKIA